MATELTVPNDLAAARRLQDVIEEALTAADYSAHDTFAIKLAVEEALVNAIKYGNQADPDKRLHVAYRVTAERFEFAITADRSGHTLRVNWSPG